MEVTIEITNYCENYCCYCSTNATDEDTADNPIVYLSISFVKSFLQGVAEKYTIDRINISGGEPLAHNDFYDILKICKAYTENVWVYTNALTQIIYNTDVVKELKVEANACLVPGKAVYLPKSADKIHLLQLVSQGCAKNMIPAKFHVSGNTPSPNDADHGCSNCNHVLLQANGEVVEAPCKKNY